MAKTVIKQNPEKEVPTEVLADAVVAIAQGVRNLRKGRLHDNALFLLIQHAAPNVGRGYTPLSLKQIKAVFAGIDQLETTYLRKRQA